MIPVRCKIRPICRPALVLLVFAAAGIGMPCDRSWAKLLVAQEQETQWAEGAPEENAPEDNATEKNALNQQTTFVIPLEGPIVPRLRGFVERKMEEAVEAGAEVVVLDIHSPGGRLDTTFEIIELLGETDVESVAYIRHSAFSGAAMIALACDRIEMHPEAQLGDVGVIVGGPFSAFQYVEEKERSPVVSKIRTLADAKGRPAALAEAMVDKDITVFSAKHVQDGRTAFFTNKEWESLEDQDQWQQGPPVLEARENHFLTVSGTRAVELGLAEGTSRSLDAALDAVDAKRPVTVLAHTWVDTTVEILNSYWVTGLLILIGFVALFIELSAPGFGIGGLTALLCFALFFWSRFLGGTAGWLEVTLFVTALAFIAAEFFVIPGFGVAGITGVGLMLFSLVMASRRVFIPATGADWNDLGMNVLTISAALVGVMFILFFAADYFQGLPLFKRLVLEPPRYEPAAEYHAAEGTKEADMLSPWTRISVGDFGRTVSALRPSGKAQFAEDVIDVSTEGEFIAPNSPVRVFKKHGMRITVREA